MAHGDHKRTRTKTALFLQGSTMYDFQCIRDRLFPYQKLLQLEMAIIEGNLARFMFVQAGWFVKPSNGAKPTVADEELKRSLLKILLEVYVTAQDPSRSRIARLLDSQAVNLDAVDACDTPRSTRLASQYHVKEKTWLILCEEGMVVEEPLEDDDQDDLDSGYVVDEKSALQVTLGPAADSGQGEKFLNGGHQHPWDDIVEIE
ncbi:hypothetical protein ARMSODRAFT_1005400 [Armillaria solidipes]|uniref:Uncharacterized protein n=1 Tax=Armillaria solidipes TaxID=1076256 RepID=A0A2H3BNA9_9AGAR|nr:hypothetical protein ARMSODRAFT_1005400 [Armillaria solidipes]